MNNLIAINYVIIYQRLFNIHIVN